MPLLYAVDRVSLTIMGDIDRRTGGENGEDTGIT